VSTDLYGIGGTFRLGVDPLAGYEWVRLVPLGWVDAPVWELGGMEP